MKLLGQTLENIPDNEKLKVEFKNGNTFILANFEMVDITIYNDPNYCLADIITVEKQQGRSFRAGNILEFYLPDLSRVTKQKNNEAIYISQSKSD